jgi:hypothetical protein
MFCRNFAEKGLKIYYFQQEKKGQKNGQMANSLYFWQTVSKKDKLD